MFRLSSDTAAKQHDTGSYSRVFAAGLCGGAPKSLHTHTCHDRVCFALRIVNRLTSYELDPRTHVPPRIASQDMSPSHSVFRSHAPRRVAPSCPPPPAGDPRYLPTLFCFLLVHLDLPEMDLVRTALAKETSVFACDEFSLFGERSQAVFPGLPLLG